MAKHTEILDVIIVGGGPAGLNAALVLGRCRRNVLLFDDGKPRNAVSHEMHEFLSRDGFPLAELLAIARDQLATYPTVRIDKDRVVDAARIDQLFSVTTRDGRKFLARKLLLAAGVVDQLPEQPGFRELYGIGVFHCPYCDGWEMRDQPLAVYGRGNDKGSGLALELTHLEPRYGFVHRWAYGIKRSLPRAPRRKWCICARRKDSLLGHQSKRPLPSCV